MIIHAFVGEFRFLSNFWLVPIPYKDEVYASIEHAYQAHKTLDKKLRRKFLDIKEPRDARDFGRVIPLRPDWPKIQVPLMRRLIKIKYKNPKMAGLLVGTGDAVLIEGNYWHDNFWGSCTCRACIQIPKDNHLGVLTMERRTLIARKAK